MLDLYPSRAATVKEPKLLPRIDPVIVGSQKALTQFQRESYKTNGYLMIEDFFSEDYLGEVCLGARDFLNDPPETAIMEPDGEHVRSVFAVHQYEIFDYLSRHPKLLGVAREIVGDKVYIHQSRINYKIGGSATGWTWHSDFETWHVEDGMSKMRCVTAMICLADNKEINGPLMIIPGSHKYFLSCVGDTPEGNYFQHLTNQKYGLPDKEQLREFISLAGDRVDSLVCRTGSVVFFDCNAIHGSNSNVSPWDRPNLFFVYNSVENRVVEPFCRRSPRPEYACTRETFKILEDRP